MSDSLTGLEDRAAFVRALAAARRATQVAVVLVALDELPAIDAHNGAQPAERAVKAAAAALSAGLRQGDELFRVGPDEFAAVLAVGEPAEAHAAAGRLEGALAPVGRVSIGVAVPDDAETDAALLARVGRTLREPAA